MMLGSLINGCGYGRTRSWPNSKYYTGICLEGLRKTTKILRAETSEDEAGVLII
jgi:hypothetical protein